jgi:hypothetical protein
VKTQADLVVCENRKLNSQLNHNKLVYEKDDPLEDRLKLKEQFLITHLGNCR